MDLPNDFKKLIQSMLGGETELFISSLSTSSTTSIRINHAKSASIGTNPVGFNDTPVPWCPDGQYLTSRPSFTSDPLFHAGAYYVQEASSMFLHHLLSAHLDKTTIKALDFCAAPGGKSTLLASSLPSGSLLFCNEFVRSRSQILRENIIKWGNPNVIVTNNNSDDYAHSGVQFDLILCDAPCSGEGMFRKDPAAITEWSLENVNHCHHRQREIISTIWDCLSPGGLFIYSTCTYNTKEDEDNAAFIEETLGGIALDSEIPSSWGIDRKNYSGRQTPVYRFFPHKALGEGFFICVFRKPDGVPAKARKHKELKHKSTAKIPMEIKYFIKDAQDYTFCVTADGTIYAFNVDYSDFIDLSFTSLTVVHAGVELARLKGKKYIPSQSLAMSNIIELGRFPHIEADLKTALSYLRCESLYLPNAPKGYVLITYHGYPLGFVNNIGSRANNLYPNEWRIRHL